MPEYIEREAAIRALTLHDCDSARAKMAICDIPAVDVVPVVHGKWVYGNGWLRCSNCGATLPASLWQEEVKFCNNCGAMMDREE